MSRDVEDTHKKREKVLHIVEYCITEVGKGETRIRTKAWHTQVASNFIGIV